MEGEQGRAEGKLLQDGLAWERWVEVTVRNQIPAEAQDWSVSSGWSESETEDQGHLQAFGLSAGGWGWHRPGEEDSQKTLSSVRRQDGGQAPTSRRPQPVMPGLAVWSRGRARTGWGLLPSSPATVLSCVQPQGQTARWQ